MQSDSRLQVLLARMGAEALVQRRRAARRAELLARLTEQTAQLRQARLAAQHEGRRQIAEAPTLPPPAEVRQ